jgi:hypothetical protein
MAKTARASIPTSNAAPVAGLGPILEDRRRLINVPPMTNG